MSKALSFVFLFLATGLLVFQLFVGNYIVMDLSAATLIIIAIIRIEKLQKEAFIAKERAIKRQREIYNVTHDKLTGLYTKEILFHKIKDTISQNTNKQYWVAYFDIKDFKIVNDIFGNDMGDSVLLKVASWLRENSTMEWVYGRLGGDDFGICLPAGDANLKQLERRFARYVISNGSIEHRILMHMGIYKITEPDIDVSLMFDRAQLALTSVKNEYNKHIAFYDDKMRDQVMWDQMISAQIEKAIEEKQVQPYLQPIVDNNGQIIGAEALIRWDHPKEGFLQPETFIPTFEKNGMIADLDKFIWRSACEILSTWTGEKANLFISINISPKDFLFMDVFAEINALIEEFNIEPSRLRIEITETVMMTEVENRMAILNRFRESGFIVEMDDFGSGYSSLNQLKDMPLDVLKIDMKFLSSSKNSQKAEIILRNVLKLSGDLGLSALTEGVETEDQYNMLSQMGCNLFQGYFFAKPMTVDEFEKVCDSKVA
ncbi:MAG: bifunctional diguanylate cyclase/phosphodiesterase [Fibrobacter sp.]|nr:bifunctional diguanylate cyclase/phosphodiesterase [Fibrobacter sp.]